MVSFQPAMQVHDDLAALFSRNLTFNPELQAQQALLSKPADNEPKQLPSDPVPEISSSPITYSISAHYTHSAHIPRQPTQTVDQQQGQEPQRRASEPPQSQHAALETIFVQNGLNCSVFAPSQAELFRTSEEPQRQRLLEIWKAAPPTSELDNPSVAWSTTTLEQEEQWAKMRYERLPSTQTQPQQTTMSLDGTQVQSADSCWVSTSPAEPYMMSGYEELMRRDQERQAAAKRAKESFSPYGSSVGHRYSHSTDPVYMNTASDWQQQMQMENQYGSFQQNQFGPSGNAEAMEIM